MMREPCNFQRWVLALGVFLLVVASCTRSGDPPPSELSSLPSDAAAGSSAEVLVESSQPKERDSEGGLSLLTYNIYVHNQDVPQTIDLIRELDASIVCLQETTAVTQPLLHAGLSDRYPHRDAYLGRVGNGPMVLSKLPIEGGRYVGSKRGYNGYWFGKVQVGSASVQLVNLHLHPTLPTGGVLSALRTWREAEGIRLGELDEVMGQLLPDLPTLLVGDFNTLSTTSTFERVQALGYRDSALDGLAPTPDSATFRGSIGPIALPVRIDYLFHSSDVQAVGTTVVERGTSDHFPVLAKVKLSAG